ncbi:MAG: ribosome silencing factor [Thermoanaerobaculia bacterium]
MTIPARHSLTAPAALVSAEDIRARVRAAVGAAHDTKAENVRVRHLEPVTSFADYFVIASASNERQVQAIANAVEEQLLELGVRALHVEGYGSAQWVLLDYGDFLVHSLLEERRDYYGLERLWRDAPDVTPDFEPEDSRRGPEAQGEPEEAQSPEASEAPETAETPADPS